MEHIGLFYYSSLYWNVYEGLSGLYAWSAFVRTFRGCFDWTGGLSVYIGLTLLHVLLLPHSFIAPTLSGISCTHVRPHLNSELPPRHENPPFHFLSPPFLWRQCLTHLCSHSCKVQVTLLAMTAPDQQPKHHAWSKAVIPTSCLCNEVL